MVTWEPDVGTALRCNDFTDIRESTIYNDCRGTKLGTGAVGTKHHPEFSTKRYPESGRCEVNPWEGNPQTRSHISLRVGQPLG